ncbi:MAG: hypothetical protein LCH70_03245 [Proteobacteria bacterium]|nr:hypothetical protein [Pseudomonadota bacterium]
MLKKLTQIDDLTRSDHWYLEEGDSCLFFGEYTAHKGYDHSHCNQLIVNLKHPPAYRLAKPYVYRHKIKAINEIAAALVAAIQDEHIANLTFVPIPPSKAKSDPAYDARCTEILRRMANHTTRNIDVRELVIQTESTAPSHESDNRLKQEDLIPIYQIDEALTAPPPRELVIFDDMLTTGSHFKAMQHVLSQRFPGVPIHGIFVARRKPENPFEDEDEWQ